MMGFGDLDSFYQSRTRVSQQPDRAAFGQLVTPGEASSSMNQYTAEHVPWTSQTGAPGMASGAVVDGEIDRSVQCSEAGSGLQVCDPPLHLEGDIVNQTHIVRPAPGGAPVGFHSPRGWPSRPPPHHPYRAMAPRHPYYTQYRHHPGLPPYSALMHPYPGAPTPTVMGRRQHPGFPGHMPYGIPPPHAAPPPGYGLAPEEDAAARAFQSPFLQMEAQEAALGPGGAPGGQEDDTPGEPLRQMHSEGGAMGGPLRAGGAAAGGPGPTSSDGGATSAASAGGAGPGGSAPGNGGLRSAHYSVPPPLPPPAVYNVPYGLPYRPRHVMYGYPPPPPHYYHPEDVPAGPPYGRRLAATHSVPLPLGYNPRASASYPVLPCAPDGGVSPATPFGVPRVAAPGGEPQQLLQPQSSVDHAAAPTPALLPYSSSVPYRVGGKEYAACKQSQELQHHYHQQQQQQPPYGDGQGGSPQQPMQLQQHQQQQSLGGSMAGVDAAATLTVSGRSNGGAAPPAAATELPPFNQPGPHPFLYYSHSTNLGHNQTHAHAQPSPNSHFQPHPRVGDANPANPDPLRRAFSADPQQLRMLAASHGGVGATTFPPTRHDTSTDLARTHFAAAGTTAPTPSSSSLDLCQRTPAEAAAAAMPPGPVDPSDLPLPPLPELLTHLGGSPSRDDDDEEERLHAELRGLIGDLTTESCYATTATTANATMNTQHHHHHHHHQHHHQHELQQLQQHDQQQLMGAGLDHGAAAAVRAGQQQQQQVTTGAIAGPSPSFRNGGAHAGVVVTGPGFEQRPLGGTASGSPSGLQPHQSPWTPSHGSAVRQVPPHYLLPQQRRPPPQQHHPQRQSPVSQGGMFGGGASGSGRSGDGGVQGEGAGPGMGRSNDTGGQELPLLESLYDSTGGAAAAAGQEQEAEDEEAAAGLGDDDGGGLLGAEDNDQGMEGEEGNEGTGEGNEGSDGEMQGRRPQRRRVAARRQRGGRRGGGAGKLSGGSGTGGGGAGSAGSGDELQIGARPTVERLLSQSADTVVDLEVLGDLEPQTVSALLEKVQRKGKGGRAPAEDPRLDPSIDPRKARRILANRISAARSKLKQKLVLEGLKARYQQLLSSKGEFSRELSELKRACKELETRNRGLLGKLKDMSREPTKQFA